MRILKNGGGGGKGENLAERVRIRQTEDAGHGEKLGEDGTESSRDFMGHGKEVDLGRVHSICPGIFGGAQGEEEVGGGMDKDCGIP